MKSKAAKTRFLQRLKEVRLSLDSLTPAAGVDALLAFYTDERADGCDIDKDGDIDLVCPGKSGLYLFENLSKSK